MAFTPAIATWMTEIAAFHTRLLALRDAHESALMALRLEQSADRFGQELSGSSWRQLELIDAELARMYAELVALGYTLTA